MYSVGLEMKSYHLHLYHDISSRSSAAHPSKKFCSKKTKSHLMNCIQITPTESVSESVFSEKTDDNSHRSIHHYDLISRTTASHLKFLQSSKKFLYNIPRITNFVQR